MENLTNDMLKQVIRDWNLANHIKGFSKMVKADLITNIKKHLEFDGKIFKSKNKNMTIEIKKKEVKKEEPKKEVKLEEPKKEVKLEEPKKEVKLENVIDILKKYTKQKGDITTITDKGVEDYEKEAKKHNIDNLKKYIKQEDNITRINKKGLYDYIINIYNNSFAKKKMYFEGWVNQAFRDITNHSMPSKESTSGIKAFNYIFSIGYPNQILEILQRLIEIIRMYIPYHSRGDGIFVLEKPNIKVIEPKKEVKKELSKKEEYIIQENKKLKVVAKMIELRFGQYNPSSSSNEKLKKAIEERANELQKLVSSDDKKIFINKYNEKKYLHNKTLLSNYIKYVSENRKK
jgi:hypothetical protein